MQAFHYDAFCETPHKGNPAGVVLDAGTMTAAEMQRAAARVGFNETAFVSPSETADVRLRYFTPGHEVDLCGHATIAALMALYEKRGLSHIETIETQAGTIGAGVLVQDGQPAVTMKQLPAEFVPFRGDKEALASVLGLAPDEIDPDLPIVYGSTGIWTLLIPVKRLDSFKKMRPENASFPKVLTQLTHASIHPFCLETYASKAQMHGRHFSSPFSSTIEDPVTGTASGAMGAYYLKYVNGAEPGSVLVEQGQEIGRDGFVGVNVVKSGQRLEVEIEGKAVFVKSIDIDG